jgi:Fibronectin type III-like domain
VTWYPQDFTRVPMSIMRMRADPPHSAYPKDGHYPGRTYRFYKGYTVFQFGYGLSYSNYSHEIITQSDNQLHTKITINLHAMNIDRNLKHYHVEEIGSEACKNSTFPVTVRVKNHGPMDGGHPILMFIRWPTESNGKPVKQLIGMDNVYLKAGEVVHVKFAVSPCKHLSRTTEDGKWVIEDGSHFLMVEEDELKISVSA